MQNELQISQFTETVTELQIPFFFPLPRTKSTSQDEEEDDDGCDMAKEMKRAGKKQQQRDGEEWREEKRGKFETCRRALKNVSHNYILLRTN